MWSRGNVIIKQHVLSDSDCTGSWGWGWGVGEQSFSHGKHNEGGVDGDSDVPAKYTLYCYIYDTISKNFQKINWLIVGCLNLSDKHFIHIQDGFWCWTIFQLYCQSFNYIDILSFSFIFDGFDDSGINRIKYNH